MSDLLLPGLNKYIDDLLPERNDILTEMEDFAAEHNFPIIGPQVGRFFFQICQLKKPTKIFEMGSGFGYSAYWFCKGAPEATVTLTDSSRTNLDQAKRWLSRAKFDHRIRFEEGNAQDILSRNKEKMDIIFIDVEKRQYPEAFRLALSHLNIGGILLIDNVLWYGNVMKNDQMDRDTESVRHLNSLLFKNPDIFSTIIPVRDGVALIIKISEDKE